MNMFSKVFFKKNIGLLLILLFLNIASALTSQELEVHGKRLRQTVLSNLTDMMDQLIELPMGAKKSLIGFPEYTPPSGYFIGLEKKPVDTLGSSADNPAKIDPKKMMELEFGVFHNDGPHKGFVLFTIVTNKLEKGGPIRVTDPVVLDGKTAPNLVKYLIAKQKCESCGGGSPETLLKCARCHETRYCSRDCQKKDWRVHKKKCKKATMSHNQAYKKKLRKKAKAVRENPHPRKVLNPHECWHCEKQLSDIIICEHCKIARYCSENCQNADLQRHGRLCVKI